MCETFPCPSHEKGRIHKESASLGSILLIILLPKCPFCILSYTSAIAVCGSAGIPEAGLGNSFWLTAAWIGITLFSVGYNFKGKRTWNALGLSFLGSLCLLLPYFFQVESTSYFYTGAFLLLWGVWVNGSFTYFFQKLIRPLWSRWGFQHSVITRFFTSNNTL